MGARRKEASLARVCLERKRVCEEESGRLCGQEEVCGDRVRAEEGHGQRPLQPAALGVDAAGSVVRTRAAFSAAAAAPPPSIFIIIKSKKPAMHEAS